MIGLLHGKKLAVVLGVALVLVALFPIMNAQERVDTKSKINIDGVFRDIPGPRATHHKVLGEMGTATWCPHCPSMAYWLGFVAGDFQYISLVADKNSRANQRCSELGLSGYPTTFFDGGYTSVVGHQYNVNNLQTAYNACQSRIVEDVEITVFPIWQKHSKIKVVVLIDNEENSIYNGHLHVYITEKTSRWLDYDGDPYKFAMLGYAFNKDVTINPEGTWSEETTWVGSTYGYGDITKNNILVVATVFSQSTGYADETEISDLYDEDEDGGGGGPPPTVKITYPAEGEILEGMVTITGTAHHWKDDSNLEWVYIQVDSGDWAEADGTSSWDLEWDTTGVEDEPHTISAVSYDGQKQSPVAYVSINVNNHGNHPPVRPSSPEGPSSGDAGAVYTYSTSTTDPENENIKYGWDWDGDNIVDEWTEFSSPGEIIDTSHSWSTAGTYYVKVKAEDIHGDQSSFSSSLEVTVSGTNEPPDIPDIDGPASGKTGEKYEYMFSALDPEDAPVYFYIDWGDGTNTDWIGPYPSGEEIQTTHIWNNRGDYEIKIKAKDIHDAESDWATLEVSMPRSNPSVNDLVIYFSEQLRGHFPILFQLLIHS
jgi:hypothetical protein